MVTTIPAGLVLPARLPARNYRARSDSVRGYEYKRQRRRSLHQAILDANANPGADVINFNIGSGLQTISPTSTLPDISDPVLIDGRTQPGFSGTPLIEINAGNIPSLPNRGVLNITSGNT